MVWQIRTYYRGVTPRLLRFSYSVHERRGLGNMAMPEEQNRIPMSHIEPALLLDRSIENLETRE